MDLQRKHRPHLPFYKPPHPPIGHQPLAEKDAPKPVPPPPAAHQPAFLHQRVKRSSLFKSIIAGTVVAGLVGLILNQLKININVILPVIAPIWVGSMTLFYQVFKEK